MGPSWREAAAELYAIQPLAAGRQKYRKPSCRREIPAWLAPAGPELIMACPETHVMLRSFLVFDVAGTGRPQR